MYIILDDAVARWGQTAGYRVPNCVDTICPFCGRPMSFSLNEWRDARNVNSLYMASRCSACNKSANFLWTRCKKEGTTQNDMSGFYMWPVPKLIRQPISGLDATSAFPEKLGRAYASAIRTFNVRECIGSTVLCGRLLEGLLKELLPENSEHRNIADGLKQLPKHVKLYEPLLKLADGIRKGRNIGAHFDPEKEPDQEITEMMLDLLDYLIEYLFILPDRVDRLHKRLAGEK